MERIICSDALACLKELDPESVNTCVTSPPYYNLRDYGVPGQIGMENTPEEYIDKLVTVFREVRRVLRSDGTLWVNIGDSYAGSGKGRMADGTHYAGKPSKSGEYEGVTAGMLRKTAAYGCKPKDLIGIPWMLAFALRHDGWYLRQDIIWHKPNAMPESVRDRCTKSHEYIFLLSKSGRYYFDAAAIREPCISKKPAGNKQKMCNGRIGSEGWSLEPSKSVPKDGRNKRDVWAVSTSGFRGAHFAVFPEKLVESCILAGCPEGGTVLDPFAGSGTTGVVAKRLHRDFLGIEINSEYVSMAADRIDAVEKNGSRRQDELPAPVADSSAVTPVSDLHTHVLRKEANTYHRL